MILKYQKLIDMFEDIAPKINQLPFSTMDFETARREEALVEAAPNLNIENMYVQFQFTSFTREMYDVVVQMQSAADKYNIGLLDAGHTPHMVRYTTVCGAEFEFHSDGKCTVLSNAPLQSILSLIRSMQDVFNAPTEIKDLIITSMTIKAKLSANIKPLAGVVYDLTQAPHEMIHLGYSALHAMIRTDGVTFLINPHGDVLFIRHAGVPDILKKLDLLERVCIM